MRLTCPNCGAEYEVPEGLIPPGGKHVQCTNCHTRWFMRGTARPMLSEDQIIRRLETWAPRPRPVPVPSAIDPAAMSEVLHEVPPEAPAAAEAEPFRWESARSEVAAPAPAATSESEPETVPAPASDPEPAPPISGDASALPRDLPAAGPDTNAAAPASPPMHGMDGGPSGPAPRAATRLELGPDTAIATSAPTPRPARSRFRRGFWLAVVVAAVAIGIYVSRDAIAARLPAAAPALASYGATVDGAREWLADRLGAP